MERYYYVEKDHETAETSSRLDASHIAAEWIRRGYDVTTVVVDVTDESVNTVDEITAIPPRTERTSRMPC